MVRIFPNVAVQTKKATLEGALDFSPPNGLPRKKGIPPTKKNNPYSNSHTLTSLLSNLCTPSHTLISLQMIISAGSKFNMSPRPGERWLPPYKLNHTCFVTLLKCTAEGMRWLNLESVFSMPPLFLTLTSLKPTGICLKFIFTGSTNLH